MTILPELEAVIFDMDGLMLDTERVAQDAWRQVGTEWGYDLPDEVYLQVIGRTAEDTARHFKATFGADFPFWEMYERKQQYLYAAVEAGIPTKPGLFELLTEIERLGLRKAVATSTARPIALKKLEKATLLPYFEAMVCGDEIVNGKPAPDIFLAAAGQLQFDPARCMVLEDSEAGVRGAHAAGMTPVMVPDLKPPTAELAALAAAVLPNLHAVVPLLRQACSGR